MRRYRRENSLGFMNETTRIMAQRPVIVERIKQIFRINPFSPRYTSFLPKREKLMRIKSFNGIHENGSALYTRDTISHALSRGLRKG